MLSRGAGSGQALDALIACSCQQPCQRSLPWPDEVGCDLGERPQHEGAQMTAWMGQAQAARLKSGLTMEQEIQVERAGRIAERSLASVVTLDRLQGVKQFEGSQQRVEYRHGVQEIRASGIHRCAAVQARAAQPMGARQTLQCGTGGGQRPLRIAKVGTEADVGSPGSRVVALHATTRGPAPGHS